jgi:two-component system, sensor histidine kinase RpfC
MNINPVAYIVRSWTYISERLNNRSDSEHEQAGLRLIILVMFISYLFAINPLDNPSPNQILFQSIVIPASTFISIVIFVSIIVWPQTSISRRILGIVADTTTLSILYGMLGEIGAPWFGVYLWVIFGNGFRYGERYLYLSALLSIIGFSIVIQVNSFWQQNTNMGIGLLITLIVLPGYLATLIRRMQTERHRAEQANLAKSEFLARMSHEIRTPLNGIIGTGELLETCNLGVEEKEYVATIKDSGKTLIRLIEDILDISRIEAGRMETESVDFDLYQLINSSINIFSPQARSKGLSLSKHIDINIPFYLNGDPTHLRQVLINLLGNAVKFTEKGSIMLKCSLLQSYGPKVMVRFEVTDTGIGIPHDTQERIFEKFSQADESTTRRYGGSGLGMAIAKQLVELMGGNIGVNSTPDVGSNFWFDLPLIIQNSDTSHANNPTLANTRVLRISNTVSNQTNATNYMRECNINIWDVDCIQKAKQILDHRPDDYEMILLDGLTHTHMLAEQINSIATNPKHSDKLILMIRPEFEQDAPQPNLNQQIYLLTEPLDKQLFIHALYASRLNSHYESEAQTNSKVIVNSRQLNILIAEDNPVNGMVLGRILDKNGHHHHLVVNGEQALDALKHKDYDLVIIDMHMPTLGGIDTYKTYSIHHQGDDPIPFIMLTANATVEARKQCKDAGIEHFLTKPISSKALINAINMVTHQETAHVPTEDITTQTENSNISGPIDTNTLDQIICMAPDNNFLMQLYQSMNNYGNFALDKMTQADKNEDLREFKEVAHALKGATISLGMFQLTKLLQQAENITSGRFHTQGSEYINRLRSTFDISMSMIEHEFSRTFSETKHPAQDTTISTLHV